MEKLTSWSLKIPLKTVVATQSYEWIPFLGVPGVSMTLKWGHSTTQRGHGPVFEGLARDSR